MVLVIILIPVKVAFAPLVCPECDEHATCRNGKCVCEAGYVENGNVCEGIYESSSL